MTRANVRDPRKDWWQVHHNCSVQFSEAFCSSFVWYAPPTKGWDFDIFMHDLALCDNVLAVVYKLDDTKESAHIDVVYADQAACDAGHASLYAFMQKYELV